MTGLETSVGLVLTQLVNTQMMDLSQVVWAMAVKPREIIQVDPVKIEAGSLADLTVLDLDAEWTVAVEDFESRARNSGFIGAELRGRATDVYVAGEPTMLDGRVCD